MSDAVRREESCPACAGTHVRAAGSKFGWSLRRCAGCRSLFVAPLPPATDASLVYADAYAEVQPVPPVVAASLRRLVEGAEPWRRSGRWLDVGFGDGALLDVVAAAGWRAHGTEVARPALARARERGFVVSDRPDASFPAEGFDVVSMVELVEHVPDATSFVAEAFRLLRPGGLLYLSTPNVLSLNARLLGTGWSVVSPPDHLVLFSARALRLRLEASGFQVRRLRFEGLNPAELLARLRARGPAPDDYHRQNTAVALAESLSGSPWRRGLRRAANAVLSAARAGDTLKVWAVRP